MSAYSVAVLADSPDVYYRLDDSTGAPTIADSSGNGHTATNGFGFLSVASLLPLDADTASQWDYSVGPLRLDGPYSVSQQPLTVEFVVKPASLSGFSGGDSTVVASGSTGGWACQYRVTTGTWRFKTFGVKDYDFTAAAVSGTVQHIVFVLQASNAVDLYVNGAFQQTVTSVSGIGATTGVITLASISGGGTYMTGQIDEVAVYKSALSAGRIAAHYAAGFGGATVYNQSVSGALSFAGAAQRADSRKVTAALSFSGARSMSASRKVTAALTPAGVVSRATSRRLTGTFTPAGALHKAAARLLSGVLHPTATFAAAGRYARTLTSGALSFIGGAQLYPDPILYPSPDEYPFGGAILFQLNRTLSGALQPIGALATHSGLVRTFTAAFQPQVTFFKTSARVFLAAEFSSAGFTAQKISTTTAKALFASLHAAGSLSTGVNPGVIHPGGGGFGVPMPDGFFTRYEPTLRRQKAGSR